MKFLDKYWQHKDKKYDIFGVTGLTTETTAAYIANVFRSNIKNILIVFNTSYEANVLYEQLLNYNLKNNIQLFLMDDFITSEAVAISKELETIRLSVLADSSNCEKKIIIANLMGYLRYLPTPSIFERKKVMIKKNKQMDKDLLFKTLSEIGYKTETSVYKTGDIAKRGYIIDIFPINEENPIRIEFWDNVIDDIRTFNVDTQRSIEHLEEVKINPASEFLINGALIENLKQKDLPEYSEKIANVSSYLSEPIVIFNDLKQLKNSYFNILNDILEYKNHHQNEKKYDYIHDFNTLIIKEKRQILLMNLDNYISENSKLITENYNFREIQNFAENFEHFNEFLYSKRNKTIVISATNPTSLQVISKILNAPYVFTNEDNIRINVINLIVSPYIGGFESPEIVYITEKELYKQKNFQSGYKTKYKMGTRLKNIDELSIGDFVVHNDFGIGRYLGLTTLKQKGLLKDFLHIAYHGTDKVYIPVSKIELLSKYSSKEGAAPKLNKLGNLDWQKTKVKVREKIKDIAADLLKISVEREARGGFSFQKDDELQLVFESEFPYELTRDQENALNIIKKAMEKPVAMDMLLCGDVGFGKTEVAFRAAFKAIISGKQVAILCPTTILANQHYENANIRFRNNGVRIAILTRFTTHKETKQVLNKVKEGKLDLIIGTHKILNDNLIFNDLGLLIIDEEQRFGVIHKEKIKKYKSNVDVLTLTATPIPRTLQMSLTGVKNLALIETPPQNRYPIQTYVLEENVSLIKEVIYKEVSRKGQVFILYNKVQNIIEKVHEYQKIVPSVRFAYAHGQMSKSEIESTMLDFIDKKYDVLVCTTIIETGIDIPNVNSLIIIDADRFGLSQLYQIRGRVGRSNKIAYAYLMYKSHKVLNENAVKRLNAIKEFTELGSGFAIAKRDLSIRGAGDILGSEQAGFIDTVGYDLYLKILNEEVLRLKGQEVDKELIDEEEKSLIDVTTHISDSYVSDESLKIEIHQRINSIASFNDLNKIREELEDCYGKIPEEIKLYMLEELFEKMVKEYKIEKVLDLELKVEMYFSKELSNLININDYYHELLNQTNNFKLMYQKEKLIVILKKNELKKHYLYYLVDSLRILHSYLKDGEINDN